MLVDTGLRWHVRAFDRKSGEFRDFVVTRIEAPTLVDEEPKANERRITTSNGLGSWSWTLPHPRLACRIIKMDYGMTDGTDPDARSRGGGRLHAAALERGCFANHSLTEEQYRLWLSDPLALYGVENAKLAPGYRAATSTTRK